MKANYLTTIVGILSGSLVTVAMGIQDGTVQFSWKNILCGFAIALLGAVSKSFNVTGIGEKATTDKAKDGTQPTNLAGV